MYKWSKSFTMHKLVFTIGSINPTIGSVCHISFDLTVKLIDPMVKNKILYGERLVSLEHHRFGWPIIKLKDKLYGISCCILWAYIILNDNPIVKTETNNRREKKSQSQLHSFPLSFDITPELSVGVGVISHLLEVSILK
jgi:hypothetical protein